MVSSHEAEEIILKQYRNYGIEEIPFEKALGRVLAEEIVADRDLPPCDRATMDGIAIRFSDFTGGLLSYKIIAIQAASDIPVDFVASGECVEIMTGAGIPGTTDTVIRFEDLEIKDGIATITDYTQVRGQSIHRKGRDKQKGEALAKANQIISPALMGIAASVGKFTLKVKKQPRIIIISTGDELVEVHEAPSAYQVRRSNVYTVKAVLGELGLHPDIIHIPDDPEETRKEIELCLSRYDVLILSGGVSMGKFDYVPAALEALNVEKLFHKVRQRPGKPFWFGVHPAGSLVFAFPGNPVSTFLCLYRYFLLWYFTQSQIALNKIRVFAMLNKEVTFTAPVQYFMQVKLEITETGQLLAIPAEGNGSGDFANLMESDGFMELAAGKTVFKKGEVYPVWAFNKII